MSVTSVSLADDYATLGVGWQASPRDIRKAYRRLAYEWHPDRFSVDPARQRAASETMQRVNGAFRRVRTAPLRFRVARPFRPGEATGDARAAAPKPQPIAGRRLSREEIERLVAALRVPTPVDFALDFAPWLLAPPVVGLVAGELLGFGSVSLCGLAAAGGLVRCVWLSVRANPGLERLFDTLFSRLTSGAAR